MTAPIMPLVSSLRRSRRVSGKAAFSPTSIAGCVLWLDASDTATITSSGGLVSQWNDKSGNGYHLTQGTGSLQPTTGTRTLNGLNVLDFAGDTLSTSSFTSLSNWTVFVVVTTDRAANYNEIFSSNGNDFEVSFHGSNLWNWWAGSNSLSTATYSINTPYIVEALHTNGGTDTLDVNGSNVISASRNANIGAKFFIGAYHGAGSGYLDGTMAEVLVYDSVLSAGNRTSVRDYLNTKWAVY